MATNRLGIGRISFPFSIDNDLRVALEDFVSRSSDTTDYLLKPRVVSVTSTYSITDIDSIILANATSGSVTTTLPDATTVMGKHITVKKTDASANAVTVAGTIDGAVNYSLSAQNDYISIVSDGTAWHIISNN